MTSGALGKQVMAAGVVGPMTEAKAVKRVWYVAPMSREPPGSGHVPHAHSTTWMSRLSVLYAMLVAHQWGATGGVCLATQTTHMMLLLALSVVKPTQI